METIEFRTVDCKPNIKDQITDLCWTLLIGAALIGAGSLFVIVIWGWLPAILRAI